MKIVVKVNCELGKVTEKSHAWHCVAERGPKGARALCKAIGRLTEIEKELFPVPVPMSGDISTIKGPKGDGFICQNCIRTLREFEDARNPKAKAPPAAKPATAINALERIASLKGEYTAGKIPWATYDKQAHFWDHAAREAGLLGKPLATEAV